jgi:lipoprotein Spr
MFNVNLSRISLLTTLIGLLLTGCQALKPVSQASPAREEGKGSSFLEQRAISSAPTAAEGSKEESMPALDDNYTVQYHFGQVVNIETVLSNQFRYAIMMDVEVEALDNEALYRYIGDWWGTPYRMGGDSRKGIDCSAFVQGLMTSVYSVSMPRVAREQRDQCQRIHSGELKEGDLVFFNTRGGVSHVGVYLWNQHFVHASTSGGIMISSLEESYWKQRYLGAGRPSPSTATQGLSAQ